MPTTSYTLTQAAESLTEIVDFVAEGHAVQLTRAGKPVAVVIPAEEYQADATARPGTFREALQAFRQRYAGELFDNLEIFCGRANRCDCAHIQFNCRYSKHLGLSAIL